MNPDLTIPIILLHGYPFDKSMWDPQMEAMSGSYRMLPYDIRGFGAAAFNEAFITSVFHKDTLETKKDLVEGIRRVVFANSDSAIIRGLSALAERTETCAALPSIRIPTLIVCGREDDVTPLPQSEAMHAAITGSQLCVIDGAGHLSNLEQPMVFNTHLLEFLMGMRA